MRGRRPGPGARVAALGTAALALSGLLLLAARAPGAGIWSFPHAPHLSAETVAAGLREAAALDAGRPRPGGGGTVDRECRVCHDYERGGPEAHLGACDACHVDDDHLEVQRAEPAARRPPFPHREHLKDPGITCFSCHRIQQDHDWIEFSMPAAGLGERGAAGRPGGAFGEFTCADCHSLHEPGGLVTLDERTGDGKACASCHLGERRLAPARAAGGGAGAPGPRPFLHADHGGAEGRCETCHAAVRGSRTIWDYDPVSGTESACRECHVDAQGRPLVGVGESPRTTRVPWVDFEKFPHAAHLGPRANRVEVSGEVTDGCRTCHFPEHAAQGRSLFPTRQASPEPVGRDQLVDYAACLPCHAAWETPGHGVGEWSCFKCHTGAADAQGRLAMGRATVERETVEAVRFGLHHHPGVTSGGAPLGDAKDGEKECRECHVGDVEALASRLAGRRFLHDPHLGDAPGNADCLACHTTSATTTWSEDLRRFDAHLDGLPAPTGAGALARGCLECHVGASPGELGIARAVREVPQFDHKGHVTTPAWTPGGPQGIACTECHDRGGDVGYVTPPDVADCTRCHTHDPTRTDAYARTGPKTEGSGSAGSCLHCHEAVRRPGETPPRREVTRVHLRLLPGTQFHDKGGDCRACHVRDGGGAAPAYEERIRLARVTQSIHEDPRFAGRPFNDPKGDCAQCHRTEPRGYLRALGGR